MGFFAVYCAGPEKAELAHHLAKLEGADLVIYSDAGEVVIENAEGRARLAWKEDASAFRYRPETADPLRLAPILATLAADGKVDAEGWVNDADLFAVTKTHLYPDPAFRLREWALNHVRNDADLMVSLKPGWHQGSRTFDRLITLLSAHGSFDRQQSFGFAMSTDGPHAGAIRSRDLLPEPVGEERESGN
jgi:hypothetical protein